MKNEEKLLREASERLSKEYREKGRVDLRDETDVLAYVNARSPATSAVAEHVLLEAREAFGVVNSVVDLGAGPGTSVNALQTYLQPIQLSCVEKNSLFYSFGKKHVKEADWIHSDFTKSTFSAEVAYMGYSLGEVDEGCVGAIWQNVSKGLVIVEPGTPLAYERLIRVRKKIIDMGGYIYGPCPHQNPCPLPEGDWCHFAERVQRSSLHRTLKGGVLGHEDEKFFYIIVTKIEPPYRGGRVIRHPQRRKGCVSLKICDKDGIKEKIISKKDKNEFLISKKIKWGSLF